MRKNQKKTKNNKKNKNRNITQIKKKHRNKAQNHGKSLSGGPPWPQPCFVGGHRWSQQLSELLKRHIKPKENEGSLEHIKRNEEKPTQKVQKTL